MDKETDIVSYNRSAWNRQSKAGSRWCEPVDPEVIQAARDGDWNVILTPNKTVPKAWFGELPGKRVLCLASGGGQQAPILAAAGAKVTSFDNSDEQLAKDRFVAERDSLDVEIVQGDMADLSPLDGEGFDLIFHPVSNVFAENIRPVWEECFRVLNWGGRLLSGFMNPSFFLFDHDESESSGKLEVRYSLPFSDVKSLSKEQLFKIRKDGLAYEFGHTLNDQIGAQIASGFIIGGFYEDDWDDEASPLNRFTTMYIATLAIKTKIEEIHGVNGIG